MTAKENEIVLARILGLSEDDPLASSYAEARAQLAVAIEEARPVHVVQIADYIGNFMEEAERSAFEKRMAISSELRLEVEDARDFIAAVDSCRETAPTELVDAAIAAARNKFQISDLCSAIWERLPLSFDQLRHLFAEPKLRETLRRTLIGLSQLPVIPMPAVAAAASDAEVEDRYFPGGRIQSRRVRDHELEVLFTFDQPQNPPHALWLEGATGEMWLEPLPAPSTDGGVFLVRDLNNEVHALFARLLRDHATIGEFVP